MTRWDEQGEIRCPDVSMGSCNLSRQGKKPLKGFLAKIKDIFQFFSDPLPHLSLFFISVTMVLIQGLHILFKVMMEALGQRMIIDAL